MFLAEKLSSLDVSCPDDYADIRTALESNLALAF
jgi:hypothetical protein